MDNKQTIALITAPQILPGAIKQLHLSPNIPRKGDIYYGRDGANFINLGIGTTGQQLMVINGLPSWQSFPRTGVAASRPTSGRFTGDQYFATDTFALSVWTGALWKSTTLA